MARLFITPREQDLISDLTKEIMKDVVGQKIYYYAIRTDVTHIHDIYEEAVDKYFDPALEIEAQVLWSPQTQSTNRFGSEQLYTIEAYLHYKDLIDKDIDIREGDYFSYGDTFFEITSLIWQSNIYGEIEYMTGVKLLGKQARKGLIDKQPIGPTDEGYYPGDPDAIQRTFIQQRGFAENAEGPTGDVRALIEQGKLQLPPEPAPAEVSPEGSPGEISSSFYDES
jgi:hypothetical protein|tara:strand:- start:1970 stop:2644 length:675 start_codon:yes stop_codon:yes gene_type:complete